MQAETLVRVPDEVMLILLTFIFMRTGFWLSNHLLVINGLAVAHGSSSIIIVLYSNYNSWITITTCVATKLTSCLAHETCN